MFSFWMFFLVWVTNEFADFTLVFTSGCLKNSGFTNASNALSIISIFIPRICLSCHVTYLRYNLLLACHTPFGD